MINLINAYVELQKKVNEEYGIIGVMNHNGMPMVQVHKLDKFLEHGKGCEAFVHEREGDPEYPYEASFTKNNIVFLIVLDQSEYEEIIKIEGVTHE